MHPGEASEPSAPRGEASAEANSTANAEANATSNATPLARHGRLPRRHPVVSLIKGLAIALVVVVVSAGSIGAIATWQILGGAKPTAQFTAAVPSGAASTAPAVSAYSGEVNMLVVATDTRTGQGAAFSDPADQRASSGAGQNDTNLLVHINADHSQMLVISLPRDLEFPFPACPNGSGGTTPASSQAMLNTALVRGGTKGGLQCAADAVSQLTGVRIDYAALATFSDVVSMSNAIGGVTVCLATPIDDDNVTPALHLKAGNVNLVGAQAGAFLRSREGVGYGGDTSRISSQQIFMSAMMRKIVSAGTLTNPVKLYGLASTAVRSVQLSSTLDPKTLVTIGLAIKGIGLSNMVFLAYPNLPDPADSNRVIPDPAGVAILRSALQSGTHVALSPNSLGQAAVTQSPAAQGAPATSAPATPPAAPATKPSGAGSGAPTPQSTSAVLPGTATGQNASQQTCAAKKY
ncbi:LCP family protein [Frondihabitans australicus]|uniref:LytR family transcriptional attenuator n=1 Tax=Frondihabitans australicus TaxID=386892 RepID=A0A495IM78_9MICO|nr:LCP family protein [Frondihabitans australicus]RKR76371.1 LytR family transcriptional attenuator [Frondihabitans australicus]